MNEESLSALLDGECSPSELAQVLQNLERDPALREQFSRMCLAHELRRGVRPRRLAADFADRVMAALPERPDTVATAPPRAAPSFGWRPAFGLAAAAALGAVAVLVLKPEGAPAPAAAPATVAIYPLDAEADLDRRVAQLDDEKQRQLRNYLMAYSQSRAQQGMGGTLGYARYAAYTEDQRQDPAP